MGLFNQKKLASSAEVIDKHLILSLPNAIEPVVWRMALDKIGTASFEVKPVKSSDTYKLTLKPKKGTAEIIAPFADKDQAMKALLDASSAMQRPEQKTTTAQDNNAPCPTPAQAKKQGSNKWLFLFLGFLAVIGLYAYMLKQAPNTIKDFGNNQATTPSSLQEQDGVGVPLSADDFLNGL